MNASNPADSPENRKPPTHTVRVRMGTESWTIPPSGVPLNAEEPVLRIERRRSHVTLNAMRARIEQARSPSARDSRWNQAVRAIRDWILPVGEGRFRAGLKTGLASGMMFGCLALALFHQLAAPVDPVTSVASGARSAPVRMTQSPSAALSYPGLSLEVAVPRESSGMVPWLALTPIGMRHWFQEARLRAADYDVRAIRVRAGNTLIPGVVSQRSLAQQENALALAESALLAAISWAADGGRRTDAEQAVRNALAVAPSTWSSWPNGDAKVAVDLHEAMETLLRSIEAGQARSSETSAVRALNDWLRLCGLPDVIELSKMSH
ncbi:hypothetical protein [Alicyclobacillus fructus]|uniref:hypothetical protein n=1 Tax=Alicyclobacillus fructus TaxID=2816082 RepID=UPI001A8F4497|nr:hypothetical protein [Alicyclobacillus fructus]